MHSGNIFDYIDWRGDITLEQSPLNEVDALILSLISYADFRGIVPEGMENGITIEDAAGKYFRIKDIDKEKQARSMVRTAPQLIEKLSKCERFKNLILINHVNFLNVEKQEQFSAISIILDKKSIFISFRGTDDNIVGWKEDFNMSFLEEIPSQKDALSYLEDVSGQWRGKMYLGGHSKGGNLAVYAAVNALYPVKRRISKVFNNDGPGLNEKIIKSERYMSISSRIYRIVPHSSIVGMLFNHDDNISVVYSNEAAPFQHDATTWQVIGTKFVYMDGLSDWGLLMDKTMTAWLNSQDEETRMKSIEAVFGVIDNAGVKSLSDLDGKNIKAISSIMRSYGELDADVKKMLGTAVRELLKTAKNVSRQEKTIERLLSIEQKQPDKH